MPGGNTREADAKVLDLIAVLCGDNHTWRLIHLETSSQLGIRLQIIGAQSKPVMRSGHFFQKLASLFAVLAAFLRTEEQDLHRFLEFGKSLADLAGHVP